MLLAADAAAAAAWCSCCCWRLLLLLLLLLATATASETHFVAAVLALCLVLLASFSPSLDYTEYGAAVSRGPEQHTGVPEGFLYEASNAGGCRSAESGLHHNKAHLAAAARHHVQTPQRMFRGRVRHRWSGQGESTDRATGVHICYRHGLTDPVTNHENLVYR